MGKILAFDLGTTYFKTCLFDEREQLVASHRFTPHFTSDFVGRSELRSIDFEKCLCESIHAIGRQYELSQVDAVTFASQANTFTLLDSEDDPLTPFISWTDARARDQLPWLQCFSDQPGYYATTGIPSVTADFMVAKVRWLQEHEPHIVERAKRLCCLSDYLTLWLTGNFLSEASVAGMTGLADIHRLVFDAELLERAEIPSSWMPDIVRAGVDAGALRPEVALRMGLPSNCRLIIGCLDQYAGAIGAGNTHAGGVSETTGTVLATVRCAKEFSNTYRAEVFQGPAFRPDCYYQMIFSNISGALLELYRDNLPNRPGFADLDYLAEQIPMGAEGLRISHQAAAIHDMDHLFIGHTAHHGRGHEVRAILEGVAEELRRQLELLAPEQWPNEVRAAGGAAHSQLWLEIKSQRLGIPVTSVECPEPTSLGAARIVRLARCGRE